MKNISIITLLATAAIAASCSFLDEQLKGDYSSETYYTNSENAVMAVNAVYNSLYNNTEWIFGDVASDDTVKGGNAGDAADINNIDQLNATSDNGPIGTYWQHRYETIARANNAIANISKLNIDAALQTRLIAECRFLRAYSYFCLVNVFGEIPLKTQPQTSADAIHVGLSSVDKIYAQIDEDLQEAAKGLEEKSVEFGRATKGAAYGLLAKSLLFQKKYSEAQKAIENLEALHIYSLEPKFEDLFKQGGDKSPESIFALRYGNTTTASLGNNLNVWFAPSKDGGYYFNAPTQSLVDCYQTNDPRLDASLGRDGKPWFDGTIFSKSWSEATGYLVKKYNEDVVEGQARSQCTLPQHILRYADVILMKAEILNELDNTLDAIDEVNKVRIRATLPTHESSLTKEQLRDKIRRERRCELAFEFHRFGDIMRYGKDYAESCLGIKFTGERYYFPIPQAEIDANKALK
ncbi:MAG: RagB/SusD family nutrient uptake outer membrane protein [Bacteroidales bacterium]|nr:RagB/SusD family nutrient uptake outer membrane protein [Bacteroidales bacterium]